VNTTQVKVLPPAFSFHTKGVKLAKKDGLLGKSDPFFVVRASYPGFADKVTLYRSEVVKQNLHPEWKQFQLSAASLGGYDIPFSIEVYDWDADGGHDLIGKFKTTLRELSCAPIDLPLVNPESSGRIGYRSSGAFAVTSVQNLSNEQISTYSPAYKIHPAGCKLNSDSDTTFFEVRKKFPGFDKPTLLYRSEDSQGKSPQWKPFELSMMMTGTLDAPFQVSVFSRKEDGDVNEVGECTVTLREWTFPDFSIALINEKNRKRSNYKSSGAFLVEKNGKIRC